jgi:hypothetical protein
MKKTLKVALMLICSVILLTPSIEANTLLGAECKYASKKVILFGCVGETIRLCKGSADCPPPALTEFE